MPGKIRRGDRVYADNDGNLIVEDGRGRRRPFDADSCDYAARHSDDLEARLIASAAVAGGPGLVDNVVAAMTPGGIEAQEKRGQLRQEKAKTLPIDLNKAQFEAVGFKFGKVIDKLFQEVDFPEGWTKRATDHSMWSDIVDEKGRKRGSIFYKAAFYDQSAHASLCSRFSVHQTYPEDRDTPTVSVYIEDKCGVVKLSIDGLPNATAVKGEFNDETARQKRLEVYDLVTMAKKQIWERLKEEYPDAENVNAHWN